MRNQCKNQHAGTKDAEHTDEFAWVFAIGVALHEQGGQQTRHSETDIVLGLVLTHGRKETAALLEGLPRIPEQEIEYHGKMLARQGRRTSGNAPPCQSDTINPRCLLLSLMLQGVPLLHQRSS